MGFLSKLFGGGKSSSDIDPQTAIDQLVTLYDVPDVKADGGISPTSPHAGEVRSIGRKLHKAGGKAYMEQARDGLLARVPWANRNLEVIWGGMKEWNG